MLGFIRFDDDDFLCRCANWFIHYKNIVIEEFVSAMSVIASTRNVSFRHVFFLFFEREGGKRATDLAWITNNRCVYDRNRYRSSWRSCASFSFVGERSIEQGKDLLPCSIRRSTGLVFVSAVVTGCFGIWLVAKWLLRHCLLPVYVYCIESTCQSDDRFLCWLTCVCFM